MKHLFLFLLLINISTAWASVTILNGLTHSHSGNSGDVVYGEVILLNTSDKNQRVKFELSEVLFSCNSERVFTEPSPHHQSSTEWFTSDIMEKTLGPKQKYTYKYSIRIPNDKSLKGSYWTVLMVSEEKDIDDLAKNKINVNSQVRYAVGLLTNVNGYDDVALDFEKVSLAKDTLQYDKALNIKVKNDGAFIEKVKVTLEVYDSLGQKIAEFDTSKTMVFPGVCKSYLLDISTLPPGDYECLLLADAREEFTGTNLSLSLDH